MNRQSREMSETEREMKMMTGINTAATNTAILIFDLAMLCAAASMCRKGKIDFVSAIVPTAALMSSFGPCVALANLGSTLQNTFAAGNRVLDILEGTPVTEEITGKDSVEFDGACVENMTFGYVEETVLSDISAEIPKGAVVGITEKSGSGKSTLLKLLMRFWTVDEGSVKISGTDVNGINTDNLRDMESFVTQEAHIFKDSIKNNLKIAKTDAGDEEIIAACKKASVHDFIMSLPDGYDTPAGELGDRLSGGEN